MISSLDFGKLTREEKIDMYKFFVSQHVVILTSKVPNQGSVNNEKDHDIRRIDELMLQCADAIAGES